MCLVKSHLQSVGTAVELAIDVGYRHIDGAMQYQNEAEVGKALENALERNNLKRGDVYITSKVGEDLISIKTNQSLALE